MSSGWRVARGELRALPDVFRAPRRSPAETRRRATDGINDMLAHATTHVPHYIDNAHLYRPLQDVDDLQQLPICSKVDLLAAAPQAYCADNVDARNYQVDSTSGTTGQRLAVRHDVGAYGYHGATVLRRFLVSGYRPWWKIAHVKPFGRPVRWFQRLGLFPRVVVNAGQDERAIADRVLEAGPRLIMGYPVVLRALLRTLSDDEMARLRTSLRMVMTDSELLTDDVAAQLTKGFGAPVLDEYSAYEVLTISTQCRAGSMHVDEDRVWLEVVDDSGRLVPDGHDGEMVVTHWRERAMPLVRYRLGDRGRVVTGRCECGSGFRRMKLTSGRTNDYVVLPGGRRVYSGVFLSIAMFADGVAECMLRQDEDGKVLVRIVPDGSAPEDFDRAVQGFRASFERLVGVDPPFAFEPAARVELTAGGKGRFVESLVDSR